MFKNRMGENSDSSRDKIEPICEGFTLIELLAVIAAIAILVSIAIPTLAVARNSANKAKTRVQFSDWATAFEAFRQEYGSYPQLAQNGAQKVVNPLGTSTNAQQVHLFHDILTGHRRDPSAAWPTTTTGTPPPPQVQNSRRHEFVSFSDSDFVTQADVNNGYNTAGQLNYIRDGFHNTSIAVITDSNLDGVINLKDSPGGYPAVTSPEGGQPIRPNSTSLPTGTAGGAHAGVMFYSAPPHAAPDGSDLILSSR